VGLNVYIVGPLLGLQDGVASWPGRKEVGEDSSLFRATKGHWGKKYNSR
jgi:hypothetical protein